MDNSQLSPPAFVAPPVDFNAMRRNSALPSGVSPARRTPIDEAPRRASLAERRQSMLKRQAATFHLSTNSCSSSPRNCSNSTGSNNSDGPFLPIHPVSERTIQRVHGEEDLRRLFCRRPGVTSITPPAPKQPKGHRTAATKSIDESNLDEVVRRLAASAIRKAHTSLVEEEEHEWRNRAYKALVNEALDVAQPPLDATGEWSLHGLLRTQQVLAEQREHVERRLEALGCHRVATQVVDELLEKGVHNKMTANEDALAEMARRRMERRRRAQVQLTHAELRQDFLPYLERCAEQKFVTKMAATYLNDATAALPKKF